MVTRIKNYNPKKSDLDFSWHLFDAKDEVLGRLSTRIATILMGKHKPSYVGHLLSGDYVVVVNASQVKITGNKFHDKIYKRHSQYPGNLKEIPYNVIQKNNPERIIELAVKGMLPKNKIGRKMFTRLKVYSEAEHPHVAQFTFSEKLKLNTVKAKGSAVKSTASAKKSSAVSTGTVKAKGSAVKSTAVLKRNNKMLDKPKGRTSRKQSVKE